MDTYISENKFTRGYYPIGVGGNINGQVIVKNNELDEYLLCGIRLNENNNSICIVKNNYLNKINSTSPSGSFFLATEARRGIYVNNSVKTYSNLVIQDNDIWNVRHGIQVMNHIGGNVMGNEIHFDIPDGDVTGVWRRKGIVSQANTNLNIYSNSITRNCAGCNTLGMGSANGDYYLTGIAQDLSEGVIQDNTVFNLPTACRIYWNCYNTTLRCNYFDNNLEGYRLDNAVLMTQGDANHPTGNQWVNNHFNRVIGTMATIGAQVDWYYDPSLGADFDPQINTPIGPFLPIQLTANNYGSFPNCIDNNPCVGCEQQRIFESLEDSGYTLYQNENVYLNQQRANQRLNDSLQLLNAGTIYDVPLQTFFTIMAMGNIGLLEDVRMYLENGDMANALLQSQSISPAELIEYNTCMVDKVCITGSENSDTLVFDEGRRNDLHFIAYQLPIFGGEAVYRARAILQLDVDDTQLSYRMLSQPLSISTQYKIYPVPNKGALTILKNEASAEPVKIDVYDLHEKLISTIPWPGNTTELKVNLHGVAPGMYLVQITSAEGTVENLKTVVTP